MIEKPLYAVRMCLIEGNSNHGSNSWADRGKELIRKCVLGVSAPSYCDFQSMVTLAASLKLSDELTDDVSMRVVCMALIRSLYSSVFDRFLTKSDSCIGRLVAHPVGFEEAFSLQLSAQ